MANPFLESAGAQTRRLGQGRYSALLLLAVGVLGLFGLLAAPVVILAQDEVPGAPDAPTLTAGMTWLGVSWTAPTSTGSSAITAYDLRYIATDADETDDANWTVVEDVWARGGGGLTYNLGALTSETEYDVQVRAVNDAGDGAWSDTASATPNDTAVAAELGETYGHYNLESASAAHFFKFTVAEQTYTLIRSRVSYGNSGISAVVLDGSGNVIPMDLYFEQPEEPWFGFEIYHRFPAGTYYVKVTRAPGASDGTYRFEVREDAMYLTHPIEICTAIDSPLSDQIAGCQWHLNNTGQIPIMPNNAGHDINVMEVWENYDGTGINVAVVDDGIQYHHEDLRENADVSLNHDYTSRGDIYNQLLNHGTLVVGAIAARDNDIGVRGVAPRSTIYGYNLLENSNDANEVDAMTRNAAITAISINSWGHGGFTHALRPVTRLWEMAVTQGVTSGYGGRGIFYVFAGGNEHEDGGNSGLEELYSYYAVTAVCSITFADQRASYSNHGSNLWVCAPAGDSAQGVYYYGILTTDNGNRYQVASGTSMSTPIVAGVAALLREANPELTWRDLKLILAASARQNDAASNSWLSGAARYGADGNYRFSHQYGFGAVDAGAAVALAETWTNVPTFRAATASSADDLNLSIPDRTGSGATTVSATLDLDASVEFVEFIEVNTTLNHGSLRNLRVVLVSPSGARSVLLPQYRTGISNRVPVSSRIRLGSARHLGESAAGTWRLEITDHVQRYAGTLESWSITAYGHGHKPLAPAIDQTDPTAGGFTVAWSAPADTGTSAITGYDVRYIRSAATDKSDDQWTVADNVWASGDFQYTASELSAEQYDVQVRAVNDAGDGVWSASSTVTPDLPEVSVSTAASDTAEGGTMTFTLQRNGALYAALDIAVSVSETGSMLATPVPTTVTFAANSATADLSIALEDDDVDEADSVITVTVTANDDSGYTVGTPASAQATATDNDLPEVWVATAATNTAEGGTMTLTLQRNGALDAALEVSVSVSETGAMLVTPVPTAATFAANSATADLSIALDDDDLDEVDSVITMTVTASDDSGYTVGTPASAQATATDNDLPQVSISTAASDTAEGGTMTFTLQRNGLLDAVIEVSVSVSETGAMLATPVPTTVTFAANSATADLSIALADDAVDEADSVITVTITANDDSGYTVGTPASAQATATDDDLPEVWVATAASDTAEGGTMTFTLQRNGALDAALEVSVSVSETGSMLATPVPIAATFAANSATADLSIALADDDVDEVDSVITVTVMANDDSAYTVGTPASAQATATDNDLPEVWVATAASDTAEGGAMTFTLQRNGLLDEALEVAVSVSETGSMLATPVPTAVTFAANSATANLSIALEDDDVNEADSIITVTVTANADSGYTGGAPAFAQATATDNDLLVETKEPGPSGLTATELKNGIWLEWTRAEGTYSHQRIKFCVHTLGGCTGPTFYQVEKSWASYAFIPYTHLASGDAYDYTIETMRNQKAVISRSNLVTLDIPRAENRPAALLPPGRTTTHPSGLLATKTGTKYRFHWTPGINSNYTDHALMCRELESQTWKEIHVDDVASTEVELRGVIVSRSDNPTERACRVFARTGTERGPMSNRVTIEY